MVVPFLGNGDVLLNVKAKAYVAGDKCDELVDLWRFVSRPQPLLIDMLQTIMECWDNLPQFYRPIEDRLFEVYDNYALGALGDYISLVAAVGRVVKDFNVSDSIPATLKGWCIDEMRTELRYRLVKAIEAGRHLGMNHDKKFRRRMLTAVQNAYYEYLVYLYKNQQVKKQAQTAAEDYCRVSFEEPDEDGNVPEAPEPVRLAVILMTSFYYENRDIPDMTTYKATRMAFDSLLYPYRDPGKMF